jgi:hypothetical protein
MSDKNNIKIQKQLVERAMETFQTKWNDTNPQEKIQLRLTPTSHQVKEKVQLGLTMDIRKGEDLLYTVLNRYTLGGLYSDLDILTSNLYAGMFVQMIETALLISVADLDRRQHEKAEGGGNTIIN